MDAPKVGADTFVEIGFTSGAGSLAAGGGTTIQARIAKNDWPNYTQTNDYSLNSTATTYIDWAKTTRYISEYCNGGPNPEIRCRAQGIEYENQDISCLDLDIIQVQLRENQNKTL
jgi:hypothetical protein